MRNNILSIFLMVITAYPVFGQRYVKTQKGRDLSIVKVHIFDNNEKIASKGTGFFISKSGLIMTTRHVFNKFFKDNSYKVGVFNYMGESAQKIELVNCNKKSNDDICILKVSGFTFGPPLSLDIPLPPDQKDKNFQVYGLCSSHLLSRETALLNDYKFSEIKDYRIRRKLGSEDSSDFKGFYKTRFLEISADVCKGDSGGPVVDKKGKVVGMVVSMAGDRSWAIHGKDLLKFERKGTIPTILEKHRMVIKEDNTTEGQKKRKKLLFLGLKRK